jgi:hypothetical protein
MDSATIPIRKDPGIGAALGVIPGAASYYVSDAIGGFFDVAGGLLGVWLGAEGFGWGFLATFMAAGVPFGYWKVRKHNKKVDALEAATMRNCPHCAERIQVAAKICRFCHRDLVEAA